MPNVLIVEDQAITAADIERVLLSNGYNVVDILDNGEDALRIASKKKIDIVLMDIRLEGDMEGTEIANYLYSYHNIPIIFLTAYNDKETLELAKQSKPLGYINKPFKDMDLITTIEVALNRCEINRELQEKKENFQIISQENSLGIAVFQKGFFKFVNPRFAELLGYNLNNIFEKSIDFFLKMAFPDFKEKILKEGIDIRKFLDDMNNQVFRFTNQNGESKWILFHSKKILFENSYAQLLSLTDISHIKNIENFPDFKKLKEFKEENDSSLTNKEQKILKIKKRQPIHIEDELFDFFGCLGNLDRFLILDILKNKKLGIHELAIVLQKSIYTVYKIIRSLTKSRMIISWKENERTVYSLNKQFFMKFLRYWENYYQGINYWFGSNIPE